MAQNLENWNQMLQQFAGAYASAKETNDWMPPDGDYMVVLVEVDRGVTTKEPKYMYYKPWAELQDGVDKEGNSLVGRRFSLGFLSLAPGREGMLKSFVSRLAGATVNDLSVADQILNAAVGTVMMVKVSTRASKDKTGKETNYTNAYVQSIVASVPAAAAPAPPPAEQ